VEKRVESSYLEHKAQGWSFASSDHRANDTLLQVNVFTTSDSLIVEWGSKMPNDPSSSTYYLKKLN
jgi:hypothetical protein